MRFHKISDRELRCQIPMEEIKKEGLELNDILKRDERAYNFLQYVMQKAEEETGFENNGPMSVEGTVVNNALELVFRALTEEEIEKFKHKFNADSIDRPITLESKPVLPISLAEDAPWIEPITIVFNDIHSVFEFARRISIKGACVCLYSYRDQYVLRYDFIGCSKAEAGRLCQLANEFSCKAFYGHRDSALMTTEHGKILTADFMAFVEY
ncbi:MAG: adaptor protein MecA [Lachnospiraceae bacterium]|nr:adaptor protein MecA [Lachnospiraceae bacterium]